MLFLLLVLVGCNKSNKMGMMMLNKCSSQAHISPYKVDAGLTTQRSFIASNGDLVSFSKENAIWIATVDKNLPIGFSSRVKLPVCFSKTFSLEGFPNDLEKNMIHIEKTLDGQDIVYLGRDRLPGGGSVTSCEAKNYEYRISCGVLGFVTEYHKCLQCGYRREGDTEFVANSLRAHHCNECENCLVKYKCPYSCIRICKVCCGCSERIAEERRAKAAIGFATMIMKPLFSGIANRAKDALERKRQQEAASRSRSSSYTPSYNYSRPSSSSYDGAAEKKRKEEADRAAKMAAARRQASSSSSNTASDFDVSGNTHSSSTSRVTRNQ